MILVDQLLPGSQVAFWASLRKTDCRELIKDYGKLPKEREGKRVPGDRK